MKKIHKLKFIFIMIIIIISMIKLTVGIYSNSLGWISDSIHMIFYSLSIWMTIFSIKIKKIKFSENNFPYNLYKVKFIFSFFNSILLLVISLNLLKEGIEKLFYPDKVKGIEILVVSIISIVFNLFGVLIFIFDNKKEDLNIKYIIIHFFGDLIGSMCLICSSILIIYTNIYYFDSISSILISLILIYNSIKWIKKSYNFINIFPNITKLNNSLKNFNYIFKKYYNNYDNFSIEINRSFLICSKYYTLIIDILNNGSDIIKIHNEISNMIEKNENKVYIKNYYINFLTDN